MTTFTKPGTFILILFGLLIVPIIMYAFYRISLPFLNFFANDVLLFVAIPIIISVLISYFIDFKLKTKFKRYSILAGILFICCLLIFPKLKSYIIRDTEIKAEKMVEEIQRYKEKNGYWPKSLEDSHFNNLSKTAIIQRPFYYQLDKVVDGDTSIYFYFYSFHGLKAGFRMNTKKIVNKPIEWSYTD